MSSTSLYAVYKTKANHLSEYRNGHGSGPAIWDYISEKCFGERFNMFDTEKEEKFWALWKDPRLTRNEKAVLLSTYDGAIVEKEFLEEFAAACKEVHQLIIENTRWDWNHFKDIGESVSMYFSKLDYRCLGVGIGCTSISDPWEYCAKGDLSVWGVYESIDNLEVVTLL
jgi:hypothetical protein